MIKRLLQAITLATSFISFNSLAADAFDMEKLKQLFNGYQRQAAYDYANRYLAQMEGDGNFDYLYGVAAMDSGHASQGVFALERVLIQFPDDHVARLELARGYYILEEYARSRQEFEKVLAINPPRGVRETTETFLEQIRLKEARYRTTTGGFVALGIGSDSNINSAPEQLTSDFFTFEDTSISQDDTYLDLTATWGVGHPFAPGWMATANLTAALHQNSEWDDFNTTAATLQTGVSRVYGSSRYKGELLYQQYTVDGFEDNNRNLMGLNADWQFSFSQKSKLNTGLQYLALSYPDYASANLSKDSALMTLNLTWTQSFSSLWTPSVFANLSLGQESPDADNPIYERDIQGLRVGSMLAFSSTLALQMSLGMQTSDYAENTYQDSNFNSFTNRSDDLTTASLNLLWLINKDWRLDSKFSYTQNDTDINIYAYDRTTIGLEANYAF